MTAEGNPGQRKLLVPASVAAVSLVVLLCWLFDAWHLIAFGQEYIPVAPTTAWLMLMLAGAQYFFQIRKPRPLLRGWAWASLFVISGFSLLVLYQSLVGFELPLERWLFPGTAKVGNVAVGRMSPLTAMTFLLAVPGVVLGAPQFSHLRVWRQCGSFAALATLIIGVGMVISYAAGAPFLYGNHFVPMALLTAILFALIGFSILASADPDTWPTRVFRAELTSSPSSGLISKGSVTGFLFFAAAIVAAGSAHLNYQLSSARAAVEKELSAIASLKVAQISDWYKERQVDAQVVLNAPIIQEQGKNFLSGASGSKTEDDLLTWIQSQQKFNGYKRVVLYDANGAPRLWAPATHRPPDGTSHKDFSAALRFKDIMTTDLHHIQLDGDSGKDETRLYIWVPIGASSMGQTAIGLLLIEVDPHDLLFPLIQSWPIPSNSAETLLVRKEGGKIIYLNDLHHRSDASIVLRMPVEKHSTLSAALELKGQEGVVEALDYREVSVLAVTRKIEGTPWSLVVKVDKQEIYAPLRTKVWITSTIMLILVFTGLTGIRLLLQRQGRYLLQQQLAREQEASRHLAHSNRLYTVLSMINRIIVQVDDRQVLFQEVCRIMVENGGFRMACIGKLGTSSGLGHLAAAHVDLLGLGEPPCLTSNEKHEYCASTLISGEQPFICNRVESDTMLAMWREKALRCGFGSLAAAPIRLEDNSLAALTIYSSEPDFFSNDEVKLLEEVCADIGYALQNIDQKRLKLETDQAMKQMQVQVIQQDKLASIGQLAAGVAHEINNPIGFINSNLSTLAKYVGRYDAYIAVLEETVQEQVIGPARDKAAERRTSLKIDLVMKDIRQLIDESIEGTDRVKKIVQDLKTFSRNEGSETSPTDLNLCLDSTINMIWNEIKYVANLTRDYGEIPRVCCNPQQISQVLMNLLINAAHAIEKQGQITVRTWSVPDAVFVSITDTGCGIPPEHLDHIFEAFYTTKEPGRGTGLGLSISSEIVRKHGGEIMVASEIGKGTTFTIRLPLSEPGAGQTDGNPAV